MTFQIFYSPLFLDEVERQVGYLRAQQVADDKIEAWFDRLFDTCERLIDWPRQWPVDASRSSASGRKVRKLVYGSHLVFYEVVEESRRVDILSFVHGALERGIS